MRPRRRLAKKKEISASDLESLIEVAHADPYVPTRPFLDVIKEELTFGTRRRILVFDRASAFSMLSRNPETFMWVSPLPDDFKEKLGIVENERAQKTRIYKDLLIYRDNYRLTDTDLCFIRCLENEIEKAFGKEEAENEEN